MDSTTDAENKKLLHLTESWKHAKHMENEWSAKRIAIESEIYELKKSEFPDKGTTTLATGMKVSTGYSESWDERLLASAYRQWPIDTVKFPFESVYKPDTKAINVIRESMPGLYRLIQPALTIKPRKPSFSVKG